MHFDIDNTTFVSIDVQNREPGKVHTWENRHTDWVRDGFTPDDLNAAERHWHEVMLPNALKVAAFALEKGMPRVFVHWDKGVVNERFDLVPADHIIPKTEMDAFISSNIAEVLEEIGRKTLLMIGGHTQGCLGRSATSALKAGYTCICVRDATHDCSLIRWPKGIANVAYHAVVDTEDLESIFARA
jgi:nicotinamidase-related amidase